MSLKIGQEGTASEAANCFSMNSTHSNHCFRYNKKTDKYCVLPNANSYGAKFERLVSSILSLIGLEPYEILTPEEFQKRTCPPLPFKPDHAKYFSPS